MAATYRVLWLLSAPLPRETITPLLPQGYSLLRSYPGKDSTFDGHPLFLELGEEVGLRASGFNTGDLHEAKIEIPWTAPPSLADAASRWPGSGLLYKARIDMSASPLFSGGAALQFGLSAWSSTVEWTKNVAAATQRYTVFKGSPSVVWKAITQPWTLFAAEPEVVYRAELRHFLPAKGPLNFSELQAAPADQELPAWAPTLAIQIQKATEEPWQPAYSVSKVARHFYDYDKAKIVGCVEGTVSFSRDVCDGKMPESIAVRGVELEIPWTATGPMPIPEAGL